MEQYIRKGALVAEINKRIMDAPINHIGHQRVWAYNDVKDILNTLEVKEVDLNEEIEKCLKRHSMLAVGKKDFTDIAKHFFELGLSVNNPITAADRGMAEEIIINLKRVEHDYHINLTREMEWLRNQVKKGE